MIRLMIPSIDERDMQAVREVLASGFLVQSRHVVAFEQAVASHLGVPHAVAVSNGTAALHLSLLALGIAKGDIVVVTTYSWPATANVIEMCGAEPAFVDIQGNTFNMDPKALDATLSQLMSNCSSASRVKAILPIHAFGQLADMPSILTIAGKYNLPVIEDAACALGASWQGRQAGTWGTMGCFSFHPRKAITTGEGGMIVTHDAALARQLRALRNHGLDPDCPQSDFFTPGLNYRLTEFQAALGVTQMQKLDHVIAVRRRLARRYDQLLAGTGITPPAVADDSQPVYQSYVTLLPARAAARRQEMITSLKQQGIETTIGTWHMPMLTYYRKRYGYVAGNFPVTDDVFARSLTLPLHEQLTDDDQRQVVDALRSRIAP